MREASCSSCDHHKDHGSAVHFELPLSLHSLTVVPTRRSTFFLNSTLQATAKRRSRTNTTHQIGLHELDPEVAQRAVDEEASCRRPCRPHQVHIFEGLALRNTMVTSCSAAAMASKRLTTIGQDGKRRTRSGTVGSLKGRRATVRSSSSQDGSVSVVLGARLLGK